MQVDQDYMFYKMQAECTQSFPKQVDIVDLRAETNVISKLGREQGSAFRKSSESQTDAAEVNKKSTLSDSMSRSFLSSIPGCRFWLGPLWQDRHRDTNPKRGNWRPTHWSRWCHRSGLHNNYHFLCFLPHLLCCFPDGPADRLPELQGRPFLQLWGESSRPEEIFSKSDALGAQG